MEFRTNFNSFNGIRLNLYGSMVLSLGKLDRGVKFSGSFQWVNCLRLTAKLVHMHHAY